MNDIKIFNNEEFGQVRTANKNGQAWFCLSDICKSLELTNVTEVKKRLNKKGLSSIETLTNGGRQKLLYINESNLYKVIFQSRKEEAEKFQEWVTDDVLPSIRKHGMYAIEELLNNPDLLIKVATQLKEEKAKNKVLEEEKKINQPKVHYHDRILNSPSLMPITSIAKDYGMTAEEMNKLLKELKVQFKMGEQWILYRKYDNLGYVSSKPLTIKHKSKPTEVKNQTQWTQKGRKFIYDLLKEQGILPTIEKEAI